MGKCIAYVAAAAVLMGLGALIAGACVWFLAPRKGEAKLGIPELRKAECNLIGSDDVSGTIYLQQYESTLLSIEGNITGLPDGLHGFHIHEWGVPADENCVACGGHYNPEGFNHGAPDSNERHVGDLGNINATESTQVEIEDHVAALFGAHSIVGRSIVIHAGVDDLGLTDHEDSKKTGNAGGRLACCTIYLVKADKPKATN